jgi:thioredoxin 1
MVIYMMLLRKTRGLLSCAVLLLSLVACNQADSTPLAENTQPGVQTLPKLVDVGADKCIPCIKMAPILEALKNDFSGRMDVEFVDAWKRREEAARYEVQMIPTQIFYDEKGKELYRHTGFYGREDILGKWQELGYSFKDDK